MLESGTYLGAAFGNLRIAGGAIAKNLGKREEIESLVSLAKEQTGIFLDKYSKRKGKI